MESLSDTPQLSRIHAGPLEIAYFESGPEDGWPVILSHGFPFDAHAYDEVAALLSRWGARVIVLYLRGFGATRIRHDEVAVELHDQIRAADLDRIVLREGNRVVVSLRGRRP